MADARRFTRLRTGVTAPAPGLYVVPDDGMCLSTFLVVRPPGRDREVLLGRVDPDAPWFDLAALEPDRVKRIGSRWMLPSSQLLFFESPDESAARIAREQLGAGLPPREGFSVHSEAYRRPEGSARDPHWDLHFVYRVRWPDDGPPRAAPWSELAFVDLDSIAPGDIARGQADVLALVGLAAGPTGTPGATIRPARTRRP